jgi:hypothetical protein
MNNTNASGNNNNSNNNNINEDLPEKKNKYTLTTVRKVKKGNISNNDNSTIIVEEDLDEDYKPRPIKRAKTTPKKTPKKSPKKIQKKSSKKSGKVPPVDGDEVIMSDSYLLILELIDMNRLLEAENQDLKRQLESKPQLNENPEQTEPLAIPNWLEKILIEKEDLSAKLSAKDEEFKTKEQELKNQELQIKEFKDKEEEMMCGICMENPRSMIAVPCGHLYACRHCMEVYIKKNNTCPVCRVPVTTFYATFNA